MSALPATRHRVLAIPELLDTIFRMMDNHCNLTNSLVCRAWSEIALDTLWRQVDDLHRLFNLLAPLRKASSGKYEFSRLPESNDWLHFQRYSKRVRVLLYDENESDRMLNQTVFDDIARTRVTLSVLPNMHTLSWRATIPLCVMFMHSNVKRFIVHLPEIIESTSPRPFFDDIVARMPALTYLDVRTNIPMNSLEEEAVRLLSSLSKLQKLTMPRFFFTTRVAECLSRLPKLGCIEFQYFEEQGAGNPVDVTVFKPELSEGAFASLWDLSLTAAYKDVERFLTIPFSPSNLTMLYVESPNIESPTIIQRLFTAISENCQMLKLLALISPRRATSDSDPTTIDVDQRINMETLKPLLGCANLTSLEIIHRHPLGLQREDLEVLALRWPSLETLNLNNEPLDLHSSDLTLDILIPFARHCPHLTHLSIFIDASSNAIPSFSPTSALPTFKNLQRLSMGLSIITESTSVAIFLSQILPLECIVDSGIIWDESFQMQDETGTIIANRYRLWNDANTLIPILARVRMEERERTKEMKREMDDLQIRTRILMEKFGNVVGSAESCVML
ncbi:hypothetical protein P691DRAFT_779783, partial [Macrolepiota fuliginosa MF-IS2]